MKFIHYRAVMIGLLACAFAAPAFAQSATRIRLLSTPSPSSVGQPFALSAEVDGFGGGAPTGDVRFHDGAVDLGAGGLRIAGAGKATVGIGSMHSCAISSAGGAMCWGRNAYGTLGDGTRTSRSTPGAVSGLMSGVVAIAAGSYHTCAVGDDSGVKCWGWNASHQLGDGTTALRLTPVAVSGLSSVVAIEAGVYHTCAVTGAGAAMCWGNNDAGQLGDGTTLPRAAPVAVSRLSSGVVAIAAGELFSCALTKSGGVWCWGANYEGQLGDGTTSSRSTPTKIPGLTAVAISAGSKHACAVTTEGAAKCWGYNFDGQLGDGTSQRRLSPVPVVGLSTGIAAISAGSYHTCALKTLGGAPGALCWGDNTFGQLGDGSFLDSLTPRGVVDLDSGGSAIACSHVHSCSLSRSGKLQCWGSNFFGQLGDRTKTNRNVPVFTRAFRGIVRAKARVWAPALAIGTHNLSANYPGDATHAGSSAVMSHTVQ